MWKARIEQAKKKRERRKKLTEFITDKTALYIFYKYLYL